MNWEKTPHYSDIVGSSYSCVLVENNNIVEDDGMDSIEAEAAAETPKVSLFTIFTNYFWI